MKHVLCAVALIAGAITVAGGAAASAVVKAYPGKNGLIAFVRGGQIYTISASGTGLKQLTSSGKNTYPVWSPAGTEIAYEHTAGSVSNIWVMNANGSGKRQWTNTGTTWGSPAWSPSGKTLLFTTGGQWGTLETTSGTTPLQPRTALHGYNEQQATGTVLHGNNPSWGPGNIAFTATNNSPGAMCEYPGGSSTFGQICIEIYNTTTHDFTFRTNSVNLTANCGADGGDGPYLTIDKARWAPNGSNLVYQYQNEVGDTCSATPCFITSTNSPVPATKAGDQQPDYSPDGTKIVLVNALPGQTASIVIETNTGTSRKTLTQGYEPNWQPLP